MSLQPRRFVLQMDQRDTPFPFFKQLHRILTGLDRDSIDMREVSPMGGLLPQDERQAALQEAG